MGKFVTLTSLVRVMNENEMQQVASQLYNKERRGAQRATWVAFRDAVAQAGTGPALVAIQEWIKAQKIQEQEAAQVVESAAQAARQPTEEYMRAFYQMVTNPEINQQSHLNESALLSFTQLAHTVYVNKKESHNNYPVHSFGTFRTESGKKFLKMEAIPYLTQKLHEAISQGNTQQIHIYIRALGNLGHQQILKAFEPYLEGQKQASQFQRLLMVIAMQKLVDNDADLARSVLYKIYQNPAEDEQVRVAAVFQLMRTNPSAELLQRMAAYTNIDTSEHVNAAVKSSIESAAQLQRNDAAELRFAAQSAKHLLTKKQYGAQHSRNYLRDFAVQQMKLSYKQSVQTYGGVDSFLPKGFQLNLRSRSAGLRQQLINMQAVVSSIDDLINVVEQQTEAGQQQQQRKQQQQQENKQWSSENIAQLLGMQNENAEQLEGNLYVRMGRMQNILSFDNRTIARIPQVLREIEESLNNGKQFHHTRMINSEEMALSFPTALGFPFIFTYDRPTLISVEGKMQAKATPQVSSGETLRKPQKIEGQYQMRVLLSGRTQSQLAFIAPFNHQRYSAGYDKNFQVYVPIRGKINMDIENMQVQADVESMEPEKNTNLLHFSTWPYTAKEDVLALEQNKKIIRNQHPQKINTVFGQKATGIALRLEATNSLPISSAWLYKKLQQQDPVSALLSPWVDENIQHVQYNINVEQGMTPTKKVTLRMGYQQKRQAHRQAEGNESTQSTDIKQLSQVSQEPLQRQQEFMRKASSDIHSSQTQVVDMQVTFEGEQQITYTATAAMSKSNVDPKSRFLFMMKKSGQQKPYEIVVSAKSHIPNTNGLDLPFAIDFDSTSTTQIQAAAGANFEEATKVNAQIQFRKSESRKQYLKEQPQYEQCQREMQQGNHQLPACANMTVRANLLDRVNIQVQYENVPQQVLNGTYKLYSVLRHALYPNIEENLVNAGNGKQQVEIQGRFSPDLRTANASITTKQAHIQIQNVQLGELEKQIAVSHPVFHVKSRVLGKALGYSVYRPNCVVDKTAVNTFDNKTYHAELGKEWTVMLQYVPRRAPLQQEQQQQQQQYPAAEQLRQQTENYAVLVRNEQSSAQKEVKITLQTPKSQQQYVEITVKQASGPQQQPKVFANGQEVKYSNKQNAEIQGQVQVYALPNAEVKIEIPDAFYVISDGARVKLTATNGKLRDSVRGLCGNFDGEAETDFQSPQDCILKNPREFVASYTILESSNQNQEIAELKNRAQNNRECLRKDVMYSNVISDRDAGRNQKNQQNAKRMCTKHQTSYVVQDNQICFTLRPIPVCKSDCQQRGTVSKNIPVHCVEKNNASDLWKKQIDKGASPDFSLKRETKSIRMEIPQRCLP